MIINVQTGEVLDWSQATEEEILDDLRELEEVYQLAKQARDAARSVILDRMTRAGATLLLTDVAKVRINRTSRVSDQKLVERLYDECPPRLRDKCFKVKLEPRKVGLNELAKLGSDWKKKWSHYMSRYHTLKWSGKKASRIPATVTHRFKEW